MSLRLGFAGRLASSHSRLVARLYGSSSSSSDPERLYHKAADRRLETIVDQLEELGESLNIDGYDIMYSSGVLTLKTGIAGTYVINKQPPNRQIWLSSPKSGPRRFDNVNGQWIDTRDKETLENLLNKELSQLTGKDINIEELK